MDLPGGSKDDIVQNSELSIENKLRQLDKSYQFVPSLNLIFPKFNLEQEANESSKQIFKQLWVLHRRKSDLKFEFVSEKLLQNLLAVRDTLVGITNDQKRASSGETALVVDDLTSTYLEYLPHLCRQCEFLMTTWIRLKEGIVSNKWTQTKLFENIEKYNIKSTKFFSISTQVAIYLKSVIDDGLGLLCKLKSDKIDLSFCQDFVQALEDYNRFIEILNKFNIKAKFKTLSLNYLFSILATNSGQQLAEGLCTKISKYCNTSEKLEQYKTNTPTTLNILILEDCDQKIQRAVSTDSKQSETSDYYSSSASSSKTIHPDTTNPTNAKKNQLPRIPFASLPTLSKKLQNSYARYLEQKFSVFNLFLHASKTGKTPEENDNKNNVNLQQHTQSLWRNYVSIMWDEFLKYLYKICVLGLIRIPCLAQLSDESVLFQLVDFITDSILVVPLPQELLTANPLLTKKFSRFIMPKIWLKETDDCLFRIFWDKNLVLLFTSDKLPRLLDIGAHSNPNIRLSTVQWFNSVTWCKSVSALSAYNVQLVYSIFHLQATDDNKETQFTVWIKSRLASKTRHLTIVALEEAFPSKKVWDKFSGDPTEANDYVPYLISSVVEPFKPPQGIPAPTTLALKEICTENFFQSWLHFIRTTGLKLNPASVRQLKFDMQSAKKWIFENFSENELRSLEIFQTIDKIFDILTGNHSPQSETNSSTAVFKNKSKIAPSEFDKDDEPKVFVKISPAEFAQWKKLRTGDGSVGCCLFSLY